MAQYITGTDGNIYIIQDNCNNNMQPVNQLNFVTPAIVPAKGSIEWYGTSFTKNILPPGTAGQVIGYVVDTADGGIKLAAVNQTGSSGSGVTNLSFLSGNSSSAAQIASSTGAGVAIATFFSVTPSFDSQGKIILPTGSGSETDPTALKRASLVIDRLIYADSSTATNGVVQQTTTTKTALDAAIGATYSNEQNLDARLSIQENKSSITQVGTLPAGGSSSGAAVTLNGSNLSLLLRDGDYYLAQSAGWYTLPSPIGTQNLSIGDKIFFNAGDSLYILIPSGDNQIASEVTSTAITASSTQYVITSTNLQGALVEVSIALKTVQNLVGNLCENFIFPLGTIVNGDHFTFSSASLSSDSLVPIKIQSSKTAILTQALDLQILATSGTLPAFTIKICKLITGTNTTADGTLDTSANGTMYQYNVSSATGVVPGQRITASALNSTVGNLTFSGSSLNYLGINISGLSAPLSTESFIIQAPFFKIQ